MSILDEVFNKNSPQNIPTVAPNATTQPSINGVAIPKAAGTNPNDANYIGADQQQQNPMAGKVQQVLQKMQLAPSEENIQNVVMGVAKGKAMDPRALLKDRRSTLQAELDEAVGLIKSDNDFRKYADEVRSGRDRELRQVHYSPYGLKKFDQNAADMAVDPMLKTIADQKMKILGSRIESIQKQMLGIDEIENKVVLGQPLLEDVDYQDMIKSLLTGAPITSTKDREAIKLAKDSLDETKTKNANDISIEQIKANREASKTAFDQEKDIAKLGIEQQNADSNRLNAEKESGKAKGAANAIKMKQIDVQTTMNLVKDVSQKFNPEFFEKPNQWVNAGAQFLDSMGVNVGDEKKADIRAMTEQSQGIGQLFNQYRKMITGAAAAVQELEMLKKDFINNKDNPERARAGLQRFLKMTIRDSKIFQEMADSGVNINDKNELNGFYDTAKYRYDLDDPSLVDEAMRAAPQLFYTKPLTDEDKKVLKSGGKMVSTPNGVVILDADSYARAIKNGYYTE